MGSPYVCLSLRLASIWTKFVYKQIPSTEMALYFSQSVTYLKPEAQIFNRVGLFLI